MRVNVLVKSTKKKQALDGNVKKHSKKLFLEKKLVTSPLYLFPIHLFGRNPHF